MSFWRQLTRGGRRLIAGRSADRDLDEEIQNYLDEASATLEREGHTPEEAGRLVKLSAGSAIAVRETVRASGWEHAVETSMADLRYAMRRLWHTPGFAFVTIGTLAVGMGAATAMFSVATPVFVQTLPFPRADRIQTIWDRVQDGSPFDVTFGTFLELRERSRGFEALAVARVWQPTLTGSETPERLEGLAVSSDYFRVFGIGLRLGRPFTPADDVPNAARVVVLSDRIWRRRFGADPAVVGRQIALDGVAYDVIGVMPATFEHHLMRPIDAWRPLQYDATLPSLLGREWGHHLRMVARLRDGVSHADASAELDQIARDPIEPFNRPPWADLSLGLLIDPLHDQLTRDARPAMLAVAAAVTLLLLIASVNVVNLLIARNAARRAELTMRMALGAGRVRLIRQLLAETLVVVTLGGCAGMFVAQAAVGALVTLGPEGVLRVGVALDGPVFVIAVVVTSIVGLLVGLAPAFSIGDLRGTIPQDRWQAVSSPHRLRRSLVVAEVAFALVLLAGAGLLFRSVQSLFAILPGFNEQHVLTMQVQVAGPRYSDAAGIRRFFQDALDRVRHVPGVVNAAITTLLPLSGDSDVYGLAFESNGVSDEPPDGTALRYAVSPSYLDVMRIPLVRGRFIGAQDRVGSPPAVVISESLARRRFAGTDPIGQRMHIGPTDRPWFTVVGIVGDVKQTTLEEESSNAVYVAPEHWHFADRAAWFAVRTAADSGTLLPDIQRAIWEVDRDQPILRVSTLERVVADTAGERRFVLRLFEVFGLTALLLTAIGIYGVVACGVNERIREIGVRTALGASRHDIVGMVLRQAMSVSILGVALGMLVAMAASPALTSLLFGISPLDPLSYLAVAATLILTAALAAAIPARRAARVDPLIALRAE